MLDLASPTQGLAAALRQPNVLDHPLLLQLLELFHRLLDGSFAVEAVRVVEVDVRYSEAGEGFLAGFAAVFGAAVYEGLVVLVAAVGEFGCEEDLFALAGVGLEPFACSFVGSWSDGGLLQLPIGGLLIRALAV